MKRMFAAGLLMINLSLLSHDRIIQTQLENGLTILVCPKKDAAVVSMQLWYNVGSKHEKDGERGIAHFIEHMMFKGTQQLSETDIPAITAKLSGYCNAFTSYDYTGYVFNIPVANWDLVLPIMADCMQNCRFDQNHLNSELKAVIQELKMRKDNLQLSLYLDLITDIFESHPYHYTIIGFKQDLWSVDRDTLIKFYKKYYTPDNAVMVVVGSVDPVEVHQKMEDIFGHIPAGNGWNDQNFYINEDIKSKTVHLHRDIQQSLCSVAYVLPGLAAEDNFVPDVFANILANGRGSRLYKLLVDELQLVVSLSSFTGDLFDKSIFFIDFSPKNEADIDIIVQHIQNEIDDIVKNGPTAQEVERARRFAEIDRQHLLEDSQKQSNQIGKLFVARKDPLALFKYGKIDTPDLMERIQHLAGRYCRSVQRHQGDALAIPQDEVKLLHQLQKESDEEDTLFLNAKIRDTEVEKPKYANSIILHDKKIFDYSQPNFTILDNGLELLWLHNDEVDTVECQLYLKANHTYDDDQLQGVGFIVSNMLLEGTKNYPDQSFANEIESYGISFASNPGNISGTFLKHDTEKGLSLLAEMLMNASFEEQAFEKVQKQAAAQAKKLWDTPTLFNAQLARNLVYKDHPYHKAVLGSKETIAAVTLQDSIDYYQKNISPQGARLALVGNLAGCDIQDLVTKTLGQWQGPVVQDLVYESLQNIEKQELLYPIHRDQVVLAFTGLSIDRAHEDFNKIALFDQVLCSAGSPTMCNRLFQLRQATGLFYTISGSLLYEAAEQPGMIFIRTIVSQDKLAQAELAILNVIDTAIDTLSQDELDEAKRALINSFDKLYESNSKKAATFAFLQRYNLPFNYFTTRAETLQKITVEQVQEAVRKLVSSDKLAVIKIGRV